MLKWVGSFAYIYKPKIYELKTNTLWEAVKNEKRKYSYETQLLTTVRKKYI